jgi:hypothetical protein
MPSTCMCLRGREGVDVNSTGPEDGRMQEIVGESGEPGEGCMDMVVAMVAVLAAAVVTTAVVWGLT